VRLHVHHRDAIEVTQFLDLEDLDVDVERFIIRWFSGLVTP